LRNWILLLSEKVLVSKHYRLSANPCGISCDVIRSCDISCDVIRSVGVDHSPHQRRRHGNRREI